MNRSAKFKLSFVLCGLFALLFAPHAVYGVIHSLVMGLFEVLELVLDALIEHLFHTSRHTTQIIVFYLMWGMFLYGAYRTVKSIKRRVHGWRESYPDSLRHSWEAMMLNWNGRPSGEKLRFVSGCFLGTLCIGLLVF